MTLLGLVMPPPPPETDLDWDGLVLYEYSMVDESVGLRLLDAMSVIVLWVLLAFSSTVVSIIRSASNVDLFSRSGKTFACRQ